MHVPAMSYTDPTAGHILRSDADVDVYPELDCVMVAQIDEAYLSHHGPELNYKPYMRLRGEIQSIVPKTPLPNNITEMSWPVGTGPLVDVFYDFDNDQMGSLIGKGYFDGNLEVPEDFKDALYEFDTTAQAIIVSAQRDGDAPIVFVDIPNRAKFMTNWEDSGYNLESDFREYVPETDLEISRQDEIDRELQDALAELNASTPDREAEAEVSVPQSEFDAQLEDATYEAETTRPVEPEPVDERESILASVDDAVETHLSPDADLGPTADEIDESREGVDDDFDHDSTFEPIAPRDDDRDEELDPEIYGTDVSMYREGVETDRDRDSSDKDQRASQARIRAQLEAAAQEVASGHVKHHHHTSGERDTSVEDETPERHDEYDF